MWGASLWFKRRKLTTESTEAHREHPQRITIDQLIREPSFASNAFRDTLLCEPLGCTSSTRRTTHQNVRNSQSKAGLPRCLRPHFKPEAHIFAKPHHVVRSPGIVKEAEVEAFREVGLLSREVPWMLSAQGDHRGIQRFNFKGAFRAVVTQPARTACMARAPPDTTSNGEMSSPDFPAASHADRKMRAER